MKSLISVVVFGLLVVGCNHHDRHKAEVYYIYPEPEEGEEGEEPGCDEDHDHHGHGHHDD